MKFTYEQLENFHSNNRDYSIFIEETSEAANTAQEATVIELHQEGVAPITDEAVAGQVIQNWLDNN